MPVDLKIGAEPSRDRAQPQVIVEHRAGGKTPIPPGAPGAVTSPQIPGQVPDRSTIPGQHVTRVRRATEVRRPLTEYGTAQAIMRVFAATPGAEMDPARFEQATASFEELRKAYPVQLPPRRPAPGYALETGDAMASEMQVFGGPVPTGVATAAQIGEAWSARPGGGTQELAQPAQKDAPAAEVGSRFTPSDAPESVRAPSDAVAGPALGAEKVGESQWAQAAPSPGDEQSTAGTLPSAKEGDAEGDENTDKHSPQEAPQ